VVDLTVSERVLHLVEPLLAAKGLEVVDVEYDSGTLRISVDQPGGVSLDAIADATRVVSTCLDVEDPLPGRYLLEVSSPGLERPLRRPEQFQRAIGSEVTLRTRAGTDGERRAQGILEAADSEGVVVAGRRLAYDEIERARTVFAWGPAARPERGSGAKKKARAS